MKALDNFLKNKDKKKLDAQEKGNLLTLLYKDKLKKNIPYAIREFENEFIKNTQLKKSFERKKRNTVLIPPYSNDCYFSFDSIDPEIKERVSQSDFWEYVNEIVTTSNFFFMSTGSVEKRLTYSSDLLKPLTFLDGEIKRVGLKIFRIIKKICDNRDRIYLPHRKIRKLIEILLNNPVEVRDECFLQLIKQIRSNPHLTRNFNEWKLMAIVSSFVSPSESFIYFFINFMLEIFGVANNDDVKQWAKYVVTRVLQTDVKSERFVLPCFEELKSIEDRRKVPIEIYYPNGASEYFFFESYSTIGELKIEIINKYGFDIDKKNYYGIYEYCSKDKTSEENYINDKIKILDVIGSWSNEIDFSKNKFKINENDLNLTYRLYFLRRFDFVTDKVQDKLLDYYLCCYQFFRNRFKFDYNTWKNLVALRLNIDFGECEKTIEDHIKYNFTLETPWIDRESITPEQYQEIIKDVIEHYKLIKEDYFTSVNKFLEICKKNPLFSAHFFPAKKTKKHHEEDKIDVFDLPEKINIAITSTKLYLLDYHFGILKEFDYNELMKWGYSAKLIIIIVYEKNEGVEEDSKTIKTSFQTRMASNIVYTLNSFINIKMGKEPEQNSLSVNENVTRETYENKFYKKVNVFTKNGYRFESLSERIMNAGGEEDVVEEVKEE